jgi:hypothetical protein
MMADDGYYVDIISFGGEEDVLYYQTVEDAWEKLVSLADDVLDDKNRTHKVFLIAVKCLPNGDILEQQMFCMNYAEALYIETYEMPETDFGDLDG